MEILNVRSGFATNSSSSHSLIIRKNACDDDCCGFEFGWGSFVAASTEAKDAYLLLCLKDGLGRHLNYNMAEEIVNALFRSWGHQGSLSEGYVDHQSVWNLPRDWDGRMVDAEFLSAWREYMNDPNVVILGGNDNDSDDPEPGSFGTPVATDQGWPNVVARQDSEAGYWTLFNRGNGMKVRFVLPRGQEWKPANVVKASAPELVDMKITDWCDAGCSFCYQGSSCEGKHADTSKVFDYLRALASMKVFEVAIGGGEPTKHPDFVGILRSARMLGVIPNFSTRNLEWFDGPEATDILDAIGGFAYSVRTADEVEAFAVKVEKRDRNLFTHKATVQYVMGVPGSSMDDFRQVVEACKKSWIRLTLLGYKPKGRAMGTEAASIAGWVDVLRSAKFYRVGIDTVLAAQSKDELEAADFADVSYQTEEGKFSMYVDAVEGKMGPSSFCDPSMMVPFENPYRERGKYDSIGAQIVRAFGRW